MTKGSNPKQQLKSSLTSMPSATPIKVVKNYQTESKYNKTMPYAPVESLTSQEWTWLHPNIQESFYQKLAAPTDGEDARIKMSCHEHALKDFDLQLEMNGLEMDMLTDGNDIPPYNESKYDDLEQKKLRLLTGKRFHQNAANAYWYWLQREKSGK